MSDEKPPLGKNPFEAEIAAYTRVSTATNIATAVAAAPSDLKSPWFERQLALAESGIAKIKSLPGSMEVRLAPEAVMSKSRRELLEAVESSEIKTFGWPIGVTLQSREEYRPRPTEEGIKAEIAIEQSKLSARSSYDYWALTQQGDFFLLQSLFEDSRGENLLFFNTRIVRVAETLLFASNLYGKLGSEATTKLKVRFTHRGLAHRVIASSSPNRLIFPKRNGESNVSQTDLVLEIGRIRDDLVESVRTVCAPMFELFDFAEFGRPIYEEIVQKFVAGVVT